jgi:indole-3-glycerol phosphate synthase
MDFLEKIIAYKRSLVAQKKTLYDKIKERLGGESYSRYNIFKKSISCQDRINIIAEIKKASPSKGLIREDFDVAAIARIYQEHGAAAISVLTEDKFFLGDVRFVKKVSDSFNLPVLAKDFFIDEGQVYEARLNGASAVLLIMAILKDAEVKQFITLANKLDLDCLVEVHSEEEARRALDCGAEIIGINHRNLKTFQVDKGLSKRLLPIIPRGKIIVAESGLSTREELIELKENGINTFLIGELFMRENNIGGKLDELLSD